MLTAPYFRGVYQIFTDSKGGEAKNNEAEHDEGEPEINKNARTNFLTVNQETLKMFGTD